jgi:hypothetical protein
VTSPVGAYVAQVDRVLGVGEDLFPASGGPGGVAAGGGPSPPAAPAGAELSSRAGSAGADYRGRWDVVAGLDSQANDITAEAAADGQRGRATATGLRRSARSQAAAIGQATGSPAGVRLLVSAMDERMADMQRLIDTSNEQNRGLATGLRRLAGAYRISGSTTAPEAAVLAGPPSPPQDAVRCWIASPAADPSRLCPPDTTEVAYVDKDGNWVVKDVASGEIVDMWGPGPIPQYPNTCWLPGKGADRAICGPGTNHWIYPDGGYLITEILEPNGQIRVAFRTPQGPLLP